MHSARLPRNGINICQKCCCVIPTPSAACDRQIASLAHPVCSIYRGASTPALTMTGQFDPALQSCRPAVVTCPHRKPRADACPAAELNNPIPRGPRYPLPPHLTGRSEDRSLRTHHRPILGDSTLDSQGLGNVCKVGGARTIFSSFLVIHRHYRANVKFCQIWRGSSLPRCSQVTVDRRSFLAQP